MIPMKIKSHPLINLLTSQQMRYFPLTNNRVGILWIYIIFNFSFISCKNDPKQEGAGDLLKQEDLIAINKNKVNEEQEQIADYISRYGYKMQVTETGLHYFLEKEGKGNPAKFKSSITLKYKINFLSGEYCYSSDSSGVMQFVMGQSDEPYGLQEGLAKMNEGGKAIIIVPSYLAYGITGDGNKIGSSQTLVYHVELLKVE